MGHHVGSKKEKQEKQNYLISPLSVILCNDIIACSFFDSSLLSFSLFSFPPSFLLVYFLLLSFSVQKLRH